MDWSHDLLASRNRTCRDCRSPAVSTSRRSPWLLAATKAMPRLLARLVDASLVVPDAVGTGTRYRVLETVRQYAAARLDESGPARRPRPARRLLPRVRHARRARADRGDQTSWFTRLDAEHENLLAALALAADGAGDHGCSRSPFH